MLLKERQTLWGIPVTALKEHGRKYRLFSYGLLVLDIVVIFGLTAFLYYGNYSYSAYGYVVVAVALTMNLIANQYLNPERWAAYKFYKRHQGHKVTEVCYKVDAEKLYSVLYCTGYRRLKSGLSYEKYCELMVSACCENPSYAKTIAHYLKKYISDSGDLTCFIVSAKKNQFFVDMKEEEDSLNGISTDVDTGDTDESEERSDS